MVTSLDLKAGGVAQGIVSITKCYKGLDVDASVVTLDPLTTELDDVGHVNVHKLGCGKLGSYSYSAVLLRWLRENANKFDAIIVDGLWQYHGYAVYSVLKKVSVPYYVFTHGMLDPWFKETFWLKHLKKYVYWWFAQYRILKSAKAVLFTCEDEKLLARDSFWPYSIREKVVGYGTTLTAEAEVSSAENFYFLYPELRSKRVFLFLSRLHQKKGCDLLLKAFAGVANQDKTLHLVMAGPDQTGWQHELIQLAARLGIADRVTWTGMLKDKAKWGALKAAEVFVLPSHQENFGIVVAEALAVGTPVLISNKVNIWREVDEANAGLVEEDTLKGTVALLSNWIQLSEEERERIKNNTVRCFGQYFDIQQAACNLIALIKNDNECGAGTESEGD